MADTGQYHQDSAASESVQIDQHGPGTGTDQKHSLNSEQIRAEVKPLLAASSEGEQVAKHAGETSPSEPESFKASHANIDTDRNISQINSSNSEELADPESAMTNIVIINQDLSEKESFDPDSVLNQKSGTSDTLYEQSESRGEPTNSDMDQSIEVEEEMNSQSCETDENGMGEQSNLVQIDLVEKRELTVILEKDPDIDDDLDGTEEPWSPRPTDEEQPFVSEQFEDGTQTIIGEGSVIGDNDCSDASTNADSVLHSPRSSAHEIPNQLPFVSAEAVFVADYCRRVEAKTPSELESADPTKIHDGTFNNLEHVVSLLSQECQGEIQFADDLGNVTNFDSEQAELDQNIAIESIDLQEALPIKQIADPHDSVDSDVGPDTVGSEAQGRFVSRSELIEEKLSKSVEFSDVVESIPRLIISQSEYASAETAERARSEPAVNFNQSVEDESKIVEDPSSTALIVPKKKTYRSVKGLFGWCTII